MENLVFVHGYLGGAAQWDGQRSKFQDRFRVITPDLPGFGDKYGENAPDSIADFAHYVLQYLSDQDVHDFHLIGHSMGGMIVQDMVRQAPARVKNLILYGTGPLGQLPGRFEPIAVSKDRVIKDGTIATGSRIAATWFLYREQAMRYHICADLAIKPQTQAMIAGLTAIESWSGRAALPNITSRTLVLWGEADRAYPWSQPEILWKEIPNASLAVVQGCAHAVHLEKPTLFNDIVMDFLCPE